MSVAINMSMFKKMSYNTLKDFAPVAPLTHGAFLQAEVDKWSPVVKASGATLD